MISAAVRLSKFITRTIPSKLSQYIFCAIKSGAGLRRTNIQPLKSFSKENILQTIIHNIPNYHEIEKFIPDQDNRSDIRPSFEEWKRGIYTIHSIKTKKQ